MNSTNCFIYFIISLITWFSHDKFNIIFILSSLDKVLKCVSLLILLMKLSLTLELFLHSNNLWVHFSITCVTYSVYACIHSGFVQSKYSKTFLKEGRDLILSYGFRLPIRLFAWHIFRVLNFLSSVIFVCMSCFDWSDKFCLVICFTCLFVKRLSWRLHYVS